MMRVILYFFVSLLLYSANITNNQVVLRPKGKKERKKYIIKTESSIFFLYIPNKSSSHGKNILFSYHLMNINLKTNT
jgi:hypothetical protein